LINILAYSPKISQNKSELILLLTSIVVVILFA